MSKAQFEINGNISTGSLFSDFLFKIEINISACSFMTGKKLFKISE